MELRPIFFKRQHESCLELHVNSFKNGHDILCWCERGDEKHLNKIQIDSSKITVTGLNKECEYVFHTENSAGEKSIKTNLFFLYESTDQKIDRIIGYSNAFSNAEDIELLLSPIRKQYKKNSGCYLLPFVIDAFHSLNEPQSDELKNFWHLLEIVERSENMQMLGMNKDIAPTLSFSSAAQPVLSVDDAVTSIKIFEVLNNKEVFRKSVPTLYEKNLELTFSPDSLYVIRAFADNDLVGELIHYQQKEAGLSDLWKETQSNMEALSDIKENDFSISFSGIDFSEKEQEFIITERAKEPFNKVFGRLQVGIDSDNNFVVNVADYDLLKALEMDFYISGKESELLFNDNFDRVKKITAASVIVNPRQLYLDGDILFYIQNSKRMLLSRLTRISTTEDISDYSDKVRLLELSMYSKRITTAVENQDPEARYWVEDILASAKSDETITADNIWKYELSSLYLSSPTFDRLRVASTILKDHHENLSYDKDFFKRDIAYYRSTDVFSFPPKDSPYILCVDFIDSTGFSSKYFPSHGGAVEVQTRTPGWYMLYAIDKQTLTRSGFIFVEAGKLNPDILTSNIRIEVL